MHMTSSDGERCVLGLVLQHCCRVPACLWKKWNYVLCTCANDANSFSQRGGKCWRPDKQNLKHFTAFSALRAAGGKWRWTNVLKMAAAEGNVSPCKWWFMLWMCVFSFKRFLTLLFMADLLMWEVTFMTAGQTHTGLLGWKLLQGWCHHPPLQPVGSYRSCD